MRLITEAMFNLLASITNIYKIKLTDDLATLQRVAVEWNLNLR